MILIRRQTPRERREIHWIDYNWLGQDLDRLKPPPTLCEIPTLQDLEKIFIILRRFQISCLGKRRLNTQ